MVLQKRQAVVGAVLGVLVVACASGEGEPEVTGTATGQAVGATDVATDAAAQAFAEALDDDASCELLLALREKLTSDRIARATEALEERGCIGNRAGGGGVGTTATEAATAGGAPVAPTGGSDATLNQQETTQGCEYGQGASAFPDDVDIPFVNVDGEEPGRFFAYTWDYGWGPLTVDGGDGTTSSSTASGNYLIATHTYEANGEYVLTATHEFDAEDLGICIHVLTADVIVRSLG